MSGRSHTLCSCCFTLPAPDYLKRIVSLEATHMCGARVPPTKLTRNLAQDPIWTAPIPDGVPSIDVGETSVCSESTLHVSLAFFLHFGNIRFPNFSTALLDSPTAQ